MAPETAATEYVFVVPAQIDDAPDIGPGVTGGAFTVMDCEEAALVPQAFDAVTVMLTMLKPVNTFGSVTVLIEFVVEMPAIPIGNVQV